jgi:hypothetical protein
MITVAKSLALYRERSGSGILLTTEALSAGALAIQR